MGQLLIDRQRESVLRLVATLNNRDYDDVLKEYRGIAGIKGKVGSNSLFSAVESTIAMMHVDGEISDGYHTFNELYRYRMLYNAAFFNVLEKWQEAEGDQGFGLHKSWKHSDGEDCFGGGWFIVMAQLPTGQISNHYPAVDWEKFNIPERRKAAKYDGHTPEEAARRLEEFLLTY